MNQKLKRISPLYFYIVSLEMLTYFHSYAVSLQVGEKYIQYAKALGKNYSFIT